MDTRTSSHSLTSISAVSFASGALAAPAAPAVEVSPAPRAAEVEAPSVVVELSPAAHGMIARAETARAVQANAQAAKSENEPRAAAPAAESSRLHLSAAIAAAQSTQLSRMRSREAEVISTEFAQAAAAAGYSSMPTFLYQTGPDGRRYAVGGSTSFDTSPAATPEASISKAQRVRAVAMGGDASPADRAAAAAATRLETEARAEIAAERLAEVTQHAGPDLSIPKVELVQAEVTLAERPEDRNLKPLRLFTREPLSLSLPEVELAAEEARAAEDADASTLPEPTVTPARNEVGLSFSRDVVA